jgi:hypothetical protein
MCYRRVLVEGATYFFTVNLARAFSIRCLLRGWPNGLDAGRPGSEPGCSERLIREQTTGWRRGK